MGNVEKLTRPRKSYKANNATELESETSLYLDIGLREKWRHVAVSGYWSGGRNDEMLKFAFSLQKYLVSLGIWTIKVNLS